MDNLSFKVIKYFRSPRDYFWRWTDDGEVIEWRDGTTLCYRNELLAVLQMLAPSGLPPLGSILLALAATKDRWKASSDQAAILQTTLDIVNHNNPNKHKAGHLRNELLLAFENMDRIHGLDKKYRLGAQAQLTLAVIFFDCRNKLSSEDSMTTLEEFRSGRVHRFIVHNWIGDAVAEFGDDVPMFNVAMGRFSSSYQLELEIRAGIRDLPAPLPIIEPEPEVQSTESSKTDLLSELANDPRTAGMAHLAKHIIAALRIPMHTHGSSDQLVGGVSDISNRGNFDRLLLSELAHDDITLLARLANNEALYLRREEVPDDPPHQKYILIDITLKMWGIPRVFAMAAALACSLNKKKEAVVNSYTLGGQLFSSVDIGSKAGVIQALEQQDTALDSLEAFQGFMQQPGLDPDGEFLLITEAAQLQSPELQRVLAELKKPLSFLFVVDRSGHLQCFGFANRHRKLINEARFDIPALLSNRPKVVPATSSNKLPAMFYCDPFWLYFPGSKLKFEAGHIFEVSNYSALAITLDRRVLYWGQKEFGAQELLDALPMGYYYFGCANASKGYLLVSPQSDEGSIVLYQFYFDNTHCTSKKMEVALPLRGMLDVYYNDRTFYISTPTTVFKINADTGVADYGRSYHFQRPGHVFTDFNKLRKIANNGYSVLNNVSRVYINQDNAISIDNRQVRLANMDVIKLMLNSREAECRKAPVNTEPELVIPFPDCGYKLLRFRWENGSCIYVDSRGFLHLQSSNTQIPEVTIVLVIEKSTACWASDNTVTGSVYFTGNSVDSMKPGQFYQEYIQRFIDHL